MSGNLFKNLTVYRGVLIYLNSRDTPALNIFVTPPIIRAGPPPEGAGYRVGLKTNKNILKSFEKQTSSKNILIFAR